MNAVLDEHARLLAQFLLFYLSLWPLRVVSTALHETAHAVAALATGQKLVAWGVGSEQVKWRFRLGGAIFYLARPMVGGMTLAVPRTLEMSRLASAFFTGSGMLVDLLQFVASLAVWSAGWNNGLVVAWMAVSIFVFLRSLVPGTFQAGGVVLDNDARLLIDAVSGRNRSSQSRLGLQLRNIRGMIGLVERIGHPGAAAYYHLHAALHEAALDNVERALKDLEQGSVPELAELPLAGELLALARLAVAVAADADDTPRIAEKVAAAFPANNAVQLSVAWYLATWRFERGLPIDGQAEVVKRLALVSGNRDQRASAEVFALSADPDRDPEERYREIVQAHPNIPGLHRIDMLTVAATRWQIWVSSSGLGGCARRRTSRSPARQNSSTHLRLAPRFPSGHGPACRRSCPTNRSPPTKCPSQNRRGCASQSRCLPSPLSLAP